MSFYNKTKARNEGHERKSCGHGGRLPRRGDCDIDVSAGDEYQIWINPTDTVMCYPSVLDTSLGENEYSRPRAANTAGATAKIRKYGLYND